MNAVHIHLMVNHVALFATLFSFFILAWAVFKKNESFYSLAMTGFIIAGVFSIIALQSGEAAEDIVENIAGFSESSIHNHEEFAEISNWVAVALSIAAIAGLFIQKRKPSIQKIFGIFMLIFSLISAGFISYTAFLGGQIRHTEIVKSESISLAEPIYVQHFLKE